MHDYEPLNPKGCIAVTAKTWATYEPVGEPPEPVWVVSLNYARNEAIVRRRRSGGTHKIKLSDLVQRNHPR